MEALRVAGQHGIIIWGSKEWWIGITKERLWICRRSYTDCIILLHIGNGNAFSRFLVFSCFNRNGWSPRRKRWPNEIVTYLQSVFVRIWCSPCSPLVRSSTLCALENLHFYEESYICIWAYGHTGSGGFWMKCIRKLILSKSRTVHALLAARCCCSWKYKKKY